jgi:hypothetical protein
MKIVIMAVILIMLPVNAFAAEKVNRGPWAKNTRGMLLGSQVKHNDQYGGGHMVPYVLEPLAKDVPVHCRAVAKEIKKGQPNGGPC